MRVLSLFSGGGLGDYGLTLAGMEIVGQVEIDEYCQKILKLRWPDVPKWRDIRDVKGKEVLERCGTVDLISGGFPCQPFSTSGKRRGKQDDRYLWPEMFRVISEIKPSWVFSENVPDVIRFALDDMFFDLESIGYSCEAFVIPACAVDAPHKRSRAWVMAYSPSKRLEREIWKRKNIEGGGTGLCEAVANAESAELKGKWRTSWNRRSQFGRSSWWKTEPDICRVDDGTPNRVDRLKLLGNGQVVQVVQWIGERIMEFERIERKMNER